MEKENGEGKEGNICRGKPFCGNYLEEEKILAGGWNSQASKV